MPRPPTRTRSSPRCAPPTPPASRCSCSPAAATSSSPTRASPGTVRAHRLARRARRTGDACSRSRPASRGTRSSRAASREGLAGVECLSGIPGSVGATPIQNVGAYGQEVAETIVSVRALRPHARRGARDPRRRVRLRLPLERVQARPRAAGSCSRSRFALDRAAGLAADPLRRARARARRRRGRARAAGRRRARRCSALRRAQGHGDRPGRPRLGVGRLVLHEPGARRRGVRGARGARPRAARRRRARAALPAARRQREDVGRVADRARRLQRAGTATRRRSRSPPSTRSR